MRTLLGVIFLYLAGAALAQEAAAPLRVAGPHAADHVVIRFKPEVAGHLTGMTRETALARLAAGIGMPPGAMLEETPLTRWLRQRRPAEQAQAAGPDLDLNRFLYLRVPPGLTAAGCVERIQDHPWVDYIELDGVGSGGLTIPNDPNFGQQWHHRNLSQPGADIHSTLAWDITTGSSNVVVAILDTGLNTSLTEFQGRTMPGYDFANRDADPNDDHGHGTAVAGTLGATGNNGTLIAGVDWHCRLMPVKVLDQDNYGLYSWWAEGVDYAVTNGAKVINLSAGGSGSSTALTRAITNAIAHDVIFVTISHNDGTGTIRYPGNLAQVICVGATDSSDARASFSNYGPAIDLVAPGAGIRTVSRSGTLATWNGTSFAAPQVAGVCALLAGLRPGLTHAEALDRLIAGADDQVGDATDTEGFDVYYGHGRLNASNTLLLAAQDLADLAVVQQARSDTALAGCELTFILTVTNRGPAAASGVILTNRLPAGCLGLRAETSQGIFFNTSDQVVFELGPMPVGGEARLQVVVQPLSAGLLTNQAWVSAAEPDLNPANNQSILEIEAVADEASPALLSAVIWPDATGLELVFSKDLSAVSLTNATHYEVVDGQGDTVPLQGIQAGTQNHRVVLQADLLARPGGFTLRVEGVEDCLGNDMTSPARVDLTLPEIVLVRSGAFWRYRDDGSDLQTAWREPGYDDAAWAVGPAPLGYGDGDEATVVNFGPDPNNKPITTYFRSEFRVPQPEYVTNLILRLRRDDGAVVYLNGQEVFRSNMPDGAILASTPASSAVADAEEQAYFTQPLQRDALVAGPNLLAVEVHQNSPSSSDLTLDLELGARWVEFDLLPPSIVRQPESQAVVAGEDVSFTVEIEGTPPFGYLWQHFFTPVAPFGKIGPTLVLTNVQPADAGLYRVVVTNRVIAFPGVASQQAELIVLADRDGDRMPDEWETAHGFDPDDPGDGPLDEDEDGLSNRAEYQAGTDPRDATSSLRVDRISHLNGRILLEFIAVSNKSYTVLARDEWPGATWVKLGDVDRVSTNRAVTMVDEAPTAPARFYRLVTPRQVP